MYGQITSRTALQCNVQSSVGNGPFTVFATLQDNTSRYNAADVVVGDKLFVLDGYNCYALHVDSILLAVGYIIQMRVVDSTNTLSYVPTGQGALIALYPNQQVPFEVSGLNQELAACINQRVAQIIDNISVTGGSGEVNTASNIGAGAGVFASKVGTDLRFKSLVAGNNAEIFFNSTQITIRFKFGYYTDDASAAAGGVPIGDVYRVDIGNPYGLAWGSLKTRNQ